MVARPVTRGGTDPPQWAALLDAAKRRCASKGTSLTRLREDVLHELWSADGQALGVYDLTARIAQRDGRRLAPNSVYRSIWSLHDLLLIRRIESRKAYVIATGDDDSAIYLLCETCEAIGVVSNPAADELIAQQSRAAGFVPSHRAIECSAPVLIAGTA